MGSFYSRVLYDTKSSLQRTFYTVINLHSNVNQTHKVAQSAYKILQLRHHFRQKCGKVYHAFTENVLSTQTFCASCLNAFYSRSLWFSFLYPAVVLCGKIKFHTFFFKFELLSYSGKYCNFFVNSVANFD